MAKIKIAVGTTSEQKIKNIINLWNLKKFKRKL